MTSDMHGFAWKLIKALIFVQIKWCHQLCNFGRVEHFNILKPDHTRADLIESEKSQDKRHVIVISAFNFTKQTEECHSSQKIQILEIFCMTINSVNWSMSMQK